MWERLKLAGLVVGVYFKVYYKIWSPVVLWLAIAWYFEISLVVALLVFIAVGMSGLGLALGECMAQLRGALPPNEKRDFYVVIDTNYKWNILKDSMRLRVEPYTLNSVYVFDSFEAAKAQFDAVSREHPFEDRHRVQAAWRPVTLMNKNGRCVHSERTGQVSSDCPESPRLSPATGQGDGARQTEACRAMVRPVRAWSRT